MFKIVKKYLEKYYSKRDFKNYYWTQILKYYSQNISNFFFIQIGSNDGITGDPIHAFIVENQWNGILVEPVKYLFDQLVLNYKNKNSHLIFENVAIAKEEDYLNLYKLEKNDEKDMPYWYDQLGTFIPEVIFSHKSLIPNFGEYFTIEKVKSITLLSLINKYNIKKVDLLHMDTEGYDFEIIKMIPFNLFKPKMIYYEHKHLSEEQQKECNLFLSKQGYKLKIINESDTFAYLY